MDDVFPILLLLLLAARRKGGPVLKSADWVWPMPRLSPQLAALAGVHREPVISDPFGSPRDGGARKHAGVDVMYKRLAPSADPKHDHGSKWFAIPDGTPVLAAADGRVWFAGRTGVGWSVVIDHGPRYKLATYYTHMSALLVLPAGPGNRYTSTVRAGQPIGFAGASPRDAESVRHLHFELREGIRGIDPAAEMRQWPMVGFDG